MAFSIPPPRPVIRCRVHILNGKLGVPVHWKCWRTIEILNFSTNFSVDRFLRTLRRRLRPQSSGRSCWIRWLPLWTRLWPPRGPLAFLLSETGKTRVIFSRTTQYRDAPVVWGWGFVHTFDDLCAMFLQMADERQTKAVTGRITVAFD